MNDPQTDADALEERMAALLSSPGNNASSPASSPEAPFALNDHEEEEAALPTLHQSAPLDPQLIAARAKARTILQQARVSCHSGYLLVKGPVGDTQQRYCHLRHQILLCYVNDKAPDPKGALPLHGSILQKAQPLRAPIKAGVFGSLRNMLATHVLSDFRFKLTLQNGTVYEMSAETAELRDRWWTALVQFAMCIPGDAYDIDATTAVAPKSATGGETKQAQPQATTTTGRSSPPLPVRSQHLKSTAPLSTFEEIDDGGWVDVEGTAPPTLPTRVAAPSLPARNTSGPHNPGETKRDGTKDPPQKPSPPTVLRSGGALPRHLTSQLLLGIPNMSGYLQKMGGRSFGFSSLQSWKQRYFRLVGPVLVYTEKESDTTPKDTYLLHKNVVVRQQGQHKTETVNMSIDIVNVPTEGSVLTLVANNETDQQHWFDALTNVVRWLNQEDQQDNTRRL